VTFDSKYLQVNGGLRKRRNRQPKFLFVRILILDAAILTCFCHSGVKTEAYSIAQAGENQHRLRSVDAVRPRILGMTATCMDCRPWRTPWRRARYRRFRPFL
jgi:hypothetical protein